jgi:hypothetical protein
MGKLNRNGADLADRSAMSRRRMLMLSGTSVMSVLVPSVMPGMAQPALAETPQGADDFIAFSRFATGHQTLDAEVGRSLFAALRVQNSAFSDQLSSLIKSVSQNGFTDVEGLEESLRGNPLHVTLLQIIRGWYSGVIEDGTNAKVYAFENALMYQPPRDVIVIPTYAHNGPNYWVAEPAPIEQMPQF